jgi:hypothetical protein
MATLILTVAGSVLGGPIGGAIGAMIGQQVDAELFKPKGREGPRLSDLKLQTSSYGTPIPQIFGTLRVAGTVIWATDLIEHRSRSGGGKGRPTTTTYSYSASFAVALSSRPIIGVRRIWADGNLLRGADGALKERGTLRVATGAHGQPVDPAIGTASGAGSATAHRGIAYALFDDLDLTAFGNRIPQLSFEVEADPGQLDAGDIGAALIGAGRVSGSALPIGGYAVLGDDPLGGGWVIAPRDAADGAAIPFGGYRSDAATGQPTLPIQHARAAARDAAGQVRLRYYDSARDFMTGQQAALVAGGGRRDLAIDLPAAASANDMAAQVARVAAQVAVARETATLNGDFAALALPIGSVINAVDAGLAGRWRVTQRAFRDGRITLGLTRHRGPWVGATAGAAGQALPSPDWPAATGFAVLLDLPPSGEEAASGPVFALAIGGDNRGWRGADVWWRRHPDVEPVSLGRAPPAAAVGMLEAPLATGSPSIFDDRNALIVRLIDPEMSLFNASDAALAEGANRAMVGGETLQFGRATPLGDGVWRLTHLLRARQATEDVAGPHAAGTGFALIDAASLFALGRVDGDVVRGGMVEWAAVGGQTTSTIALATSGRAQVPLSPVRARTQRQGADISITWTRRSRAGFAWPDYADAPLGEAAPIFELTLSPASGPVQTHVVTESALSLDRAALASVAGGQNIPATLRQIGDHGPSPPLSFAISAALLA